MPAIELAPRNPIVTGRDHPDYPRVSIELSHVMGTAHPDHALRPSWKGPPATGIKRPKTHDAKISYGEEPEEAFNDFNAGMREYMWDWEGKTSDYGFVQNLVQNHLSYFAAHPLGRDNFLTMRLPNPKSEGHRLRGAFSAIVEATAWAQGPEAQDLGVYPFPILEVIIPMTTSADEAIGVKQAFQQQTLLNHPMYGKVDIPDILVTTLFEDVHTIMDSDKITSEYVEQHERKFGKRPVYLRPFFARSDPALDSGLVPATLAPKIALSRHSMLSKKIDLPMYPIHGAGALPFRGRFNPKDFEEYAVQNAGISTATVQSAFRYDYFVGNIFMANTKLRTLLPQLHAVVIPEDEERGLREIIETFENRYEEVIPGIADDVNNISVYLPARRDRKLHTGEWAYSRDTSGIKLRAIGFTGACYTLGVPPEFYGTGRALREIKDRNLLPLLGKYYPNLRGDLIEAGRFLNMDNLEKLAGGSEENSGWALVLEDVKAAGEVFGVNFGPNDGESKHHHTLTENIYANLRSGDVRKQGALHDQVEDAAVARHSIG